MRLQTVIACAHAGATIGEWVQSLRKVFGEYHAPTGVAGAGTAAARDIFAPLRDRVDAAMVRA